MMQKTVLALGLALLSMNAVFAQQQLQPGVIVEIKEHNVMCQFLNDLNILQKFLEQVDPVAAARRRGAPVLPVLR